MTLSAAPAQPAPRARATTLWRRLPFRPGPAWPSLVLALVLVARMARRLPLLPEPTGDSAAYLAQAAYRPPLYGALLQAWQALTGGLAFLPLAQLVLLGLALAWFGVALGRALRRWWAGPAAILLALLHTAIHDSPGWLMTEAVYLATLLAGLALLCRHVERPSPAALAGAALCFGLATLTRSTGLVFVLLPPLLALLDRRWRLGSFGRRRMRPGNPAPESGRPLHRAGVSTGTERRLRPALRAATLAGLVTAGVLAAGMAATWQRHGNFEIGSWSGISLLGKALLLMQPEDLPRLPPAIAAIHPAVQHERALLAAQPDLAARLRAQVQASGDIRFIAFWPAAEAGWPAWQAADDRGKGQLALALGRQLVAAHPWEYLNLWAHDWLSLVVHPAYWPAWATTEAADFRAFPLCAARDNCWALMRFDQSPPAWAALFGVSLGGTLLGLGLALALAPRVLRRRAAPATVLVWGLALVLHASLLGSAAFEYGMVRYTIATHVLGLAMLLWAASRLRWPRRG